MNASAAPPSDWMIRQLLNLCASDTTSGREDAGLEDLRALLLDLGATLVEQPVAPGRTNVLALWGNPQVLFSTHLDTVPPYFPPRLSAAAIHGRGACDAKGQIAAQLAAIRRLLDEGREGLAWLGVVGEETDSAGAAAALSLKAHLPALRGLINGEPTGLKLGTGQRGVQHLRLRCEGRAAHSGSPELGHSAAWPLLDWLQRLRELPRPTDGELGPEVWNLGLLQAGEALNTIPAHAEANLLARVLPGSDLLEKVRRLAPSEGQVELCLDEPPDRYPILPGFESAPLPFGSDAPALRNLVPDRTVVLAGPGSIAVAHTLDENITLADLASGATLNHRLAMHFLGGVP
ncbi:MAG TPA: M20/M25/M40 family metallo-hydrolase [Geothrix sp.]|nr:M20/M25/M40 family metallo-hydrolase [Geothrix sp.]